MERLNKDGQLYEIVDGKARRLIEELYKKTVIHEQKLVAQNIKAAASKVTQVVFPFNISGKVIHSIDVLTTGWAGVTTQAWYYGYSQNGIVLEVYNNTGVERIMELRVLVRYSSK